MTTRVYLPSTLTLLADVVASGGVGPAPFAAHAVTDALREAYPDGAEEEWEYTAMSAAAQASIGLLAEEDRPLRVVIAVDTPVTPVESDELTSVEVTEVVRARKIAAIHVDSEDAGEDVLAARGAWVDAQAGDEEAAAVVERCLGHELGWFAAQEIDLLLDL